MMNKAIQKFATQFEFQPQVSGGELGRYYKFALVGMGGSHLAGDVLKTVKPDLDIIVRANYGLPIINKESLKGRLIIASSYSGNTEESIEAFNQALAQELPLIVMATGGELLKLAQKNKVPYVKIPDTGIQPRSALGFNFLALLKIVGLEDILTESQKLAQILKPAKCEEKGQVLAARTKNSVPIIYTSTRNFSLAYNWKIKLNETGKIPAFYNVLPELNHNEMTGFDVKDSSRVLSEKFYFIILKDTDDHPQIQKRMDVTAELYKARGLKVEIIELEGASQLEKIFSSLLMADWLAYYTAEGYGLESEEVPMVEEFKRLIR